MLKLKFDLAIANSAVNGQVGLRFLILKGDNDSHWLLPFKKEVNLLSTDVKRGKVTTKLPVDTGILDQKIYDITDWMNDDDIDESLLDLMRSSRLKKLDSETLNGQITIGGEINLDNGKTIITFATDLNIPLTVINYDLLGYRTNHIA